MDANTVSSILAPGALLALAFSLTMALMSGAPGAHALRRFLLARGPWMLFALPAIAMAGSLYYSEVAHFAPCELCWFQRIAMYPQALILLIAAIRRDARVAQYIVPLSAIGLLISTYHYQLELFPNQPSACSPDLPCSVRYFAVYGFISLSFMAGATFASVLALSAAIARARRVEGR